MKTINLGVVNKGRVKIKYLGMWLICRIKVWKREIYHPFHRKVYLKIWQCKRIIKII
jgi:hypothetical protein